MAETKTDQKTIVITGASGLLGRQILSNFQQVPEWKTIGLAFSRVKEGLRKVDITNESSMSIFLDEVKPNVIIHSAAERRPDVVDTNEGATNALNVNSTSIICDWANKNGATVLYMGTDYVFDGTKPPYKETDEPNPLNKYGESKLEGERVVTAANKGNIILRVPILYGPVEYLEESAVTTLFKAVQSSDKESKQNDIQRRFPTHTVDVASVIRDIIKKKLQDDTICGIYHWTGNENMTKYTMAVTMAEILGMDKSHIISDKTNSGSVKRPNDANLDNRKLIALGIEHQRNFREAIKLCLEPFANK